MAKIRILAIDGGGIRGLIPARVLEYVEALIQQQTRNPKARIGDYFDLIAGTSTGGIITAMLLHPDARYEAKEITKLYLEKGRNIFSRNNSPLQWNMWGLFQALYQPEPLEKLLNDYFGDLSVSQLAKPALFPTYNIETGEAAFISSIAIKRTNTGDKLVKDAIRATTAAPTYFPPHHVNPDAFIDGGLFANNPALCAYIEGTKFPSRPKAADMMVLSIGTGSINRTYPYERARRWGRIQWLQPTLEIYSSAASQTVHHQLKILFEQKKISENYLRLEVDLEEFAANYAMDDTSEKNMQNLLAVGDVMAQKYETQLEIFIKKIILSNGRYPHHHLLRPSIEETVNI